MTFPMNDTNPADNKTSIDYSRTTLRVTFGVIASLALLGNGLVCAVILRSRSMLKNSYNLMILSLAFTDMFTGRVHVIKTKLNSWNRTQCSWTQYVQCKHDITNRELPDIRRTNIVQPAIYQLDINYAFLQIYIYNEDHFNDLYIQG